MSDGVLRPGNRFRFPILLLGIPWAIPSVCFAQADPAIVGAFSVTQPSPYMAIHAHLLPTGKVMFWDSYERADHAQLWDPVTGNFTPAALAGYNIFCTGFSFLPDGQLLVTGGHVADFVGLANASLYNPFTNVWKPLPAMSSGRWYPTNIPLPNGDALVVSGQTDQTVGMNPLPQVFQTSAGTWRNLTSAQLSLPFYPHMFLAPDGRVFQSGPNETSRYLDTTGTGAWTPWANTKQGTRTWSSAAMYESGKVMVTGGHPCLPYQGCPSGPTNTTETINLNDPTAGWNYAAPMAFARKHHNLTILPDGKLLVTGGSRSNENESDPTLDPVRAAELWDPATNTWKTLASLSVTRSYHSVALLLPDGRVFSGGGVEPSYEVYSPPYLFKGARPTISAMPEAVGLGQTALVSTPNAASITKVSLLALGTVTHTFNAGQRIHFLPFTQAAGGLNVTIPASANLVPPGYYMLFLLNSTGVPSVGKMVRVGATTAPPPPPSPVVPAAPTNLVATVSGNKQITIAWQDNASSEDGFQIERSTNGVDFTLVKSVGRDVTSFRDPGLKSGTRYYYRVRAFSAAGSSAYSNIASATP
jgi:hypothetical protein